MNQFLRPLSGASLTGAASQPPLHRFDGRELHHRVLLGFGVWLALAVIAVSQGVLTWLPMPFPQAVLAALTLVLLTLARTVRGLRRWVLTVDPRAFVVVHLARFIGFYFLVLHARGELPWAFAVPGGWGDIAVAAGALAILFIPFRLSSGRRAWWAWNTLGLADILFVVGTAARLGLQDAASIAALTKLPLGLLPAFVVPVIISSHVLLFMRLARRE